MTARTKTALSGHVHLRAHVVHDRFVWPARLVAQARARGQRRRYLHTGNDREDEARRHGFGEGDRYGRRSIGNRLAEGPHGLGAVGRRNRHPNARSRTVDVALVIQRNGDLDELACRHGRSVGLFVTGDRVKRCARRIEFVVGAGGQLALARSYPAVLDERLVPVRADLTDRCLKVDIRGRRTHPDVHRAATDHRCVSRQRGRNIGDCGARRILLPVPLPLRSVAPQPAATGVAAEVGQWECACVRGVPVDALFRRWLVGERSIWAEVPGLGGRSRNGERREVVLEARVGVTRTLRCRWARSRRRCRKAPGSQVVVRRRRERHCTSGSSGSGRGAA